MGNKMSIVRISHNRENPYVMLNKKALEDPKLSWAAKGLWAYLMSRPDDWNVSVSHLSKIYSGKGGGEKAIWSLLKELIENGYCTRTQNKLADGSFGKVIYVIMEFKISLPHSSERHPPKDPPTNKGSLLSKESDSEEEIASSPSPDLHEQMEQAEGIKTWCDIHRLEINLIIIKRWLLKWKEKYICDHLALLREDLEKGMKKVNHEAFMEKALSGNYVDDREKNPKPKSKK